MRKIWIALLVVFLLIAGFFLYIRFTTSPQYDGERLLTGLEQETEVYFDEYGVPHIYAGSARDAYRSLGYVHAMERLFQMEMMRRVGTGTLAEMLGKDLVKTDQFFRTLGIPAHAKMTTAMWQEADTTEWQKNTRAYIEGVNDFIRNGNLPVEYTLLGAAPREFTLNDIHAIIGYMSFTFAPQLKTDPLLSKIARELGPAYLDVLAVHTLPENRRIPVHYPKRDSISGEVHFENTVAGIQSRLPAPPFMGSNAWVIGPSRTASGKVLFCNDTHIGFSQPAVWFEAHLEYPGFSFYGNHLAGVPFPLVGHSREHSYGLTMFINDDLDLFEEKISAQDTNRILFRDTLLPITEIWDTIPVKDEDPVIFKIRQTHHGSIMNDVMPEIGAITQNPVTAWWVYLKEPTRALEATWKLSHARSLQDAEAGARLIHAPGLNVMYGDSRGNIAWWASAKLPIRPQHVNPKFFLDGSTGKDEPLGWYPFEENPMSINPESGVVISANNQPDTMRNGVFFPGYYYPGDRFDRIEKTILAEKNWSQENIKKLQLETISEKHPANARQLLAAIRPDSFTRYTGILETTRNWKGTHHLDESAPVLYYKWLYHTLRLMMADELGETSFSIFLETFLKIRSVPRLLSTDHSPWWDDRSTTVKESKNDIVSKALDISVRELEEELGEDQSEWKWGKVVVSEHPHPLGAKKPLDRIFNVRTAPVEANAEGVNKLAFDLNGNGKYKVKSGPALRIIIDFADVNASESILPTGQSGNLFSKHYEDQAGMYARGIYRPQLMDEKTIRNKASSVLTFRSKEQ